MAIARIAFCEATRATRCLLHAEVCSVRVSDQPSTRVAESITAKGAEEEADINGNQPKGLQFPLDKGCGLATALCGCKSQPSAECRREALRDSRKYSLRRA
jgi:hypothetical protein